MGLWPLPRYQPPLGADFLANGTSAKKTPTDVSVERSGPDVFKAAILVAFGFFVLARIKKKKKRRKKNCPPPGGVCCVFLLRVIQ